jgi:anti-anti-sigma regulatory factor
MTTSTSLLVDSACPLKTLQEAVAMIASADGELVLDFSAVRSIDTKALVAMEELANGAERAKLTIVFRGVQVKVYKVLKLARLTSQFSFIN